jgi:hypothetical protein
MTDKETTIYQRVHKGATTRLALEEFGVPPDAEYMALDIAQHRFQFVCGTVHMRCHNAGLHMMQRATTHIDMGIRRNASGKRKPFAETREPGPSCRTDGRWYLVFDADVQIMKFLRAAESSELIEVHAKWY